MFTAKFPHYDDPDPLGSAILPTNRSNVARFHADATNISADSTDNTIDNAMSQQEGALTATIDSSTEEQAGTLT